MNTQNEVQYFDYLEPEYDQKSGHTILAVDLEKKIQHIVYSGESGLPTLSGSYDIHGRTISLIQPKSFPLTLRYTFKTQEEFDNQFNKISKLILQVNDAENSIHSPTSTYNRNKPAVNS